MISNITFRNWVVPYGHFQKSSGSMEPLEPPLTEPLQYVISLKVNYFELDYVLKSHLIVYVGA